MHFSSFEDKQRKAKKNKEKTKKKQRKAKKNKENQRKAKKNKEKQRKTKKNKEKQRKAKKAKKSKENKEKQRKARKNKEKQSYSNHGNELGPKITLGPKIYQYWEQKQRRAHLGVTVLWEISLKPAQVTLGLKNLPKLGTKTASRSFVCYTALWEIFLKTR